MWTIFTSNSKSLRDRWDKLYRVAYACCHNPDLAADLVQDTLEKAMRKQHQIKKTDSIDAWLFSILFNCWRDHCRRIKPTVDIDDVQLIQHGTPQTDNERQILINRVQTAVMKLGNDQRQVIALVDLGGMSYKLVSEILDIPIGTVMSRICRARAILKQQLEDLDKNKQSITLHQPHPSTRRIK